MPSNAPPMPKAGPITSAGWPRSPPGATRAPTPDTAAPAVCNGFPRDARAKGPGDGPMSSVTYKVAVYPWQCDPPPDEIRRQANLDGTHICPVGVHVRRVCSEAVVVALAVAKPPRISSQPGNQCNSKRGDDVDIDFGSRIDPACPYSRPHRRPHRPPAADQRPMAAGDPGHSDLVLYHLRYRRHRRPAVPVRLAPAQHHHR